AHVALTELRMLQEVTDGEALGGTVDALGGAARQPGFPFRARLLLTLGALRLRLGVAACGSRARAAGFGLRAAGSWAIVVFRAACLADDALGRGAHHGDDAVAEVHTTARAPRVDLAAGGEFLLR